MNAFFSAFHFANLAGLSLGLITPLLIFAYLKRRDLKPRIVSSILLLKALHKKPIPRKRFKPPLRFFLELAALLLLATAAAWPVYRGGGRNLALLLDNSLSMKAKNQEGKNRFDLALNALSKWLDDQPETNSYAVYALAPTLARQGASQVSKREALSLARSLAPVLAADTLVNSVKELGESSEFEEVVVLTDREEEFLNQPAPELLAAETKITLLPIGTREPNFFISSIRYEPARKGGSDGQVTFSIGLSDMRERQIEAALYSIERNTEKRLVGKRNITILPENSVDVIFDNVSSVSGVLQAEITPSGSLAHDALLDDNRAWITSTNAKQQSALLITNQGTALGLDSLLDVEVVSATQFANFTNQELEKFSLLIFHRTAPMPASWVRPPRVSTLLILPPEQNPIFPIARENLSPVISSWADEHPITTYLRVPILKPQSSLIFELPPWAQPVINAEQGTLVVAGESQGVRFAGIGFELLPFEGAKTPSLSILTLNVFRWLLNTSSLSSSFLTTANYKLDGLRSWVIVDPEAKIQRFQTTEEKVQYFPLSNPGVYRITSVTGKTRETIEKQEVLVPVNVFFGTESMTFERTTAQIPQYFYHQQQIKKGDRDYWDILTTIVFGILSFELLLRIMQSRKEKLPLAASA